MKQCLYHTFRPNLNVFPVYGFNQRFTGWVYRGKIDTGIISGCATKVKAKKHRKIGIVDQVNINETSNKPLLILGYKYKVEARCMQRFPVVGSQLALLSFAIRGQFWIRNRNFHLVIAIEKC